MIALPAGVKSRGIPESRSDDAGVWWCPEMEEMKPTLRRLAIRLSDARLRIRKAKAVYPDHQFLP